MQNDKYTSIKPQRVVLVTLLALVAACSSGRHAGESEHQDTSVTMTALPPGELEYYPSGEYLRRGYPAVPPQASVVFEHEFLIATRQVSQAEYAVCVDAGVCKPLDRAHQGDVSPDFPVVGVSWRDATTYAQWLSAKTGAHYRLPTYSEWVYAAGSAYKEDIILQDFDISDPAQRWLAEYALETQRKTSVDGALRPFGGFGANDRDILDMAGNVWEWTDTCHVRQYLDSEDSAAAVSTENCGVRVVAGAHRSYIPDFIRDAKSGACSVGVPPSNLGFRLVQDNVTQSQAATPSLRERLGLG